MSQRKTGRYEQVTVAGESVDAFVPFALPPADPAISDELFGPGLAAAEQAIARLNVAGDIVPALDWFIYAFVRKEAVLSAQIEGTRATLVDLLTFEARSDAAAGGGTAPSADVEEVTNYLSALDYARTQLADPHGLPLSMRLLNDAHRVLMRGVRGAKKRPGEIRDVQNWIGAAHPQNASFVPPPPQLLPELLAEFERFMNIGASHHPLIRAAMLHVQFETIHPYLDGNGRLGRLLITLLLEHWGILNGPLLYLSSFFKHERSEYYARLSAVRTDGDWEGWISYLLSGVVVIADEGVDAARQLFALISEDRTRLIARRGISVATLRLFELLPRHPIVTANSTMSLVQTTKPTALKAIDQLVEARVLRETTGKQRDREFVYERYLAVLRVGTDLTS